MGFRVWDLGFRETCMEFQQLRLGVSYVFELRVLGIVHVVTTTTTALVASQVQVGARGSRATLLGRV
jgi:hypothetical protein